MKHRMQARGLPTDESTCTPGSSRRRAASWASVLVTQRDQRKHVTGRLVLSRPVLESCARSVPWQHVRALVTFGPYSTGPVVVLWLFCGAAVAAEMPTPIGGRQSTGWLAFALAWMAQELLRPVRHKRGTTSP